MAGKAPAAKRPLIGTLSEKGLHEDIKDYLMEPGDRLEMPLEGYVIDIYRDGLLIEVQTGNFGAIRRKLSHLLGYYPVHLVHPIFIEKIIVREDARGRELSRKRSPKSGRPIDLFWELVYIRDLAMHPNLTFEILMTREEEMRRQDPKRRKWNGWYVHDRRLVEVVERIPLASQADFRRLLPGELPMPFTNRDLAGELGCSERQAGAITYTLRRMGVLREVGKRGRALLYV
jgi:hypothetical protein